MGFFLNSSVTQGGSSVCDLWVDFGPALLVAVFSAWSVLSFPVHNQEAAGIVFPVVGI